MVRFFNTGPCGKKYSHMDASTDEFRNAQFVVLKTTKYDGSTVAETDVFLNLEQVLRLNSLLAGFIAKNTDNLPEKLIEGHAL